MALVKAMFVVNETNQNIPVHFNPSEYSISISGRGAELDDHSKATQAQQPLRNRSDEVLSLTLYYDTYTKHVDMLSLTSVSSLAPCEDVRLYTEQVANLVGRAGNPPAHVSFVWGPLIFPGYVTHVSQSFTLFLDDGKPVRAKLDVRMNRDDSKLASLGVGSKTKLDLTSQAWKAVVAAAVAAGKLRDILR